MRINAVPGTGRRLSTRIKPGSEVMTKSQMMVAGLLAALTVGAASVATAEAHGGDEGPGMMGPGYYGMGPGMMGPGYYGMGPGMMGQGYGMGPGMIGPGYGMGPGQQQWQMGPGMMGPGYGMGPGMMAPGYGYGMGPGMMGPGYGMGPGMMGPGYGYGMGQGQQPWAAPRVTPRMDLSTDDVRSYFEGQLSAQGNQRLKVGKVEALDDNTIEAQIVTVDGSLVETYKVDRHTGAIAPAG
jgi:hypothetical protein